MGWYTVVDADDTDAGDDGGSASSETVIRCYGLSDKHTTYGDASLVNAGLL